MQVKQRLRINSAVSSISVLAILLVLFLTGFSVSKAVEASKIADALLTASFERLILRTDLHRTGSERSKMQLIAKHREIGDLLKAASNKFSAPEDKNTVNELLTLHESTGKLSKAISLIREKRIPHSPPDQLSLETEDRLLSQLNMRVYETILFNSKLHASSKEAVNSSLKFGGGGILLVLLIVSAVTFVNSASMNRTITARIARLRDGASAIGQGNLDHRIDIRGDDEFTELAASFNEMTVKLNDSYHNLRGEIEERSRAEKTLREKNAELTRLNRTMVGRELRMIELKEEVNALCEKGGQPLRYGLDAKEKTSPGLPLI